jgi:hypothetical protein
MNSEVLNLLKGNDGELVGRSAERALFQVRKGEKLVRKDVFFDRKTLKRSEEQALRRYAKEHRLKLLTVARFRTVNPGARVPNSWIIQPHVPEGP